MSNLEEDIKLILDDFYKKNYNSALKSLLPIIKKNPEYLFGLKILGSIYLQMGRLFDAHRVNKKVTELSPKDPEGHYNLAVNLKAMNSITESIKAYENAIMLKSNYVEAYNNLGLIFLEIEKFKEAKSYFIKALSLLSGSSSYAAFINLGTTYKKLGDFKNAIDSYKKAITSNNKIPEGHFNLGLVYLILGDVENSKFYFKKAISLKNDYTDAHRQISLIKKYNLSDNHFSSLKRLYSDQTLSINQKCHINFALAKAYEDIEQYEIAFKHYKEGNQQRKKILNYTIDVDINLFEKIKKINFSNKIYKSSIEDNLDINPIFIVGMPRSGTTLIEQIISCHSKVYGGGELTTVGKFGKIILKENLKKISHKDLLNFRNLYLSKIISLSKNHSYITDKMPKNFLYLGLINTLFPNSKIIHVKRNPHSTCWANFKSYFVSNEIGYCYDLSDIVKYFKLYQNLMNFWKDHINTHNFYELDYELLTNNQETEIKKLINYLDLNWEDSCLEPHLNQRPIETASKMQVRKKIYSGSANEWLKYKPYLNNIFDEL